MKPRALQRRAAHRIWRRSRLLPRILGMNPKISMLERFGDEREADRVQKMVERRYGRLADADCSWRCRHLRVLGDLVMTKHGWTVDRSRDSRIIELWPQHSTRAIGKLLGLSGQRVAQIAKRLYAEGLLAPRPSYWRYDIPFRSGYTAIGSLFGARQPHKPSPDE